MKSFILPRYVIRAALLAMLGAVTGLWLLQMVFAYLGELENVNEQYTLIEALWFIFYRSPYFLVQFIPTGALLGAVIGLGLLANNSELVIMRAAGISLYRIIGWAMLPAVLFVLISLSVNQFVLPQANQAAQAIKNESIVSRLVSVNGYWSMSQTGEQGEQKDIVYIHYADSDGNLKQVKRYQLNQSELVSALQAGSGKYQAQTEQTAGYTWQLDDVDEVIIGTQGVQKTHQAGRSLTLPIAPTDVHLLTREPDDLSLSDLYAHRQMMQQQQTRSLRHELAFWQKLFSPFAVLSLVLVASSFVFGSLRSQGLGLRVVMALLTGLLFSYLTDLSGFVALATGVSPLLMAILPIVVSALAGVYLLHRKSN